MEAAARKELTPMDVKRILETIHEVDEWTKRRDELEERLRQLPRSERGTLRAEMEIVRQQLRHYEALVEDMKRSMSQATVTSFIEEF
jgi:uncharacterized coiled-coil DUF342 family protein